MYEIEFEYRNGRGAHELTLAYVVATNETKALLELKTDIQRHQCELLKVRGTARRIEPEDFDAYIHKQWPAHINTLDARKMIRDHDHHVFVLPPIELLGPA